MSQYQFQFLIGISNIAFTDTNQLLQVYEFQFLIGISNILNK